MLVAAVLPDVAVAVAVGIATATATATAAMRVIFSLQPMKKQQQAAAAAQQKNVYAVCCARFFSYFYLIFVFAAEALAYKIPLARSCCLPLSLVKLKRFIETQLSCAFSRNAEDGRPS